MKSIFLPIQNRLQNNRFKKSTTSIPLLGLSLILFFLFHPYIQSVKASNVQPILSTTLGASIDENNTGITNQLLCVGCTISDPENVIDADTTLAAEIDLPVGLGLNVSAQIYIASDQTFSANRPAGFVVEDPLLLGLLNVALLESITITTYDSDGNELESFNSTVGLIGLLQGNGRTRLTVNPTQDFSDISISIDASLLSVDTRLDVFYAFGQLKDTDGDGIDDSVEDPNGNCIVDEGETDSNNADTDDDGIDDGVEDANQNGVVDDGETDPKVADSDNDGLDDGEEDANQNGIVDNGETDPTNPDSDDDGLDDGVEDANQNGTVDNGETDPTNPDSDNDEIKDGTEDANQNGIVDNGETDPTNPDSDNDTLLDGAEDANQNGVVDSGETDPRVGDTDNDGVNDGVEIANGSSPTDPCSPDPNNAFCNDALPIALTQFTANIEGKNIVLNWSTDSEENVEHYSIERTIGQEASAFAKIATVQAQGTIQKNANYEFVDINAHLPNTVYYYRLEQVGADGNISYSPTIAVQTLNNNPIDVFIYPNPANEQIFLQFETIKTASASISIFNNIGQEVYFRNLPIGVPNQQKLNISNLLTGVYFVKIRQGDEQLIETLLIE